VQQGKRGCAKQILRENARQRPPEGRRVCSTGGRVAWECTIFAGPVADRQENLSSEFMQALDSIHEHLNALYGAAAAAKYQPRIEAEIEMARGRTQPLEVDRGALGLSQRDVVLIAYADMVRRDGESPLQTLAGFCETHLRDLVSGVHLLPHYPYTSDDGFSVMDYFAVNPEVGTWEDVSRLGRSFSLMFDAVFNHMSAQSRWFREFLADSPEFREFFITVSGAPDLSLVVRPRALPLLTEFEGARGRCRVWTTFSADQVDLNFANPEVLLATLRALLFYVERGARFIRLDAIAYLWKRVGTTCIHLPEAHRVIQLWRAVLDAVAPHVLLVTETNVPHRENVAYFGDGTNEAQLVYNFALPPLVLHALLRSDGRVLADWSSALSLPTSEVTFFNFLASHDGIGLNPVRGLLPQAEIDFLVERCVAHGGFVSEKHNSDGSRSPYEMNIVYFDALNDPSAGEPMSVQVDRFMVSQAILLALRGVPGIYFHSLTGSRNDRAAAVSSGIPRRINRERFERGALEAALGREGSLREQVMGRYAGLLRVRRGRAAFHPAGPQRVLRCESRLFGLLRTAPDGGDRVLCWHNLSPEPMSLMVRDEVLVPGRMWTGLLDGAEHWVSPEGTMSLALRPYEIRWLADSAPPGSTSESEVGRC